MDKSLEQLTIMLQTRKMAIIKKMKKDGRILIANIESKHSYSNDKPKDKLLAIIKELDECVR